MNLTFTKINNVYVATATVNADFSLHIEKPQGLLDVMQSSVQDSEYALTKQFAKEKTVIDADFGALLYPKYIKIVSESQPTIAVLVEES